MIPDANKLRGHRKFIVAMTSLAMSFVLGLVGVVTGDNWVMLVAAIVGLYGLSNAHVHKARQGDS